MKSVRPHLATLFVMLCILLQAVISFAQTPFSIIEPKLEGKGLDLQSLNELNAKSPQLTAAQRKDSFKFYIVSSPFEGQMGEIGVTASPKPLINGKFDRELLKAIAQLMIDEMQTIDQLSPFSFSTAFINTPKYDVSSMWDCLWVQTIVPSLAVRSNYIQYCAKELVQKTLMNEEKAIQLVTSMATVFKTIHFFSVLYSQIGVGEDSSGVFTELWDKSDSFYKKYVRTEGLANFKQTFYYGIVKMGAFTDSQRKMYNLAIAMLRDAVEKDQQEVARIYRHTFTERGIYIPEELREKKP